MLRETVCPATMTAGFSHVAILPAFFVVQRLLRSQTLRERRNSRTTLADSDPTFAALPD